MFDTLRHHWTVLIEAWKAEKSKPKPETAARRKELAFLPAALEITETPASPTGRWTAITIMGVFTTFVLWATFGQLDIIATAQGRIMPSGRVKVIQPIETAEVTAIHVSDGQRVEAGEILVELNPTGARADRERLADELITARLEAARWAALTAPDPLAAFSTPPEAPDDLAVLNWQFLEGRWREHRANLSSLDGEIAKRRAEAGTIKAEIKRLKAMLPKVREQVEARKDLVAKQVTSRLRLVELEAELADTQGQLDIARSRLKGAEANVEAVIIDRDRVESEFRRDCLEHLTEARRQVTAVEQELIKANERRRLLTLAAPVDGIVQQLAVHTVGGVVTEAQALMVVVPIDGGLEIEVSLMNKDKGFVEDGQEAEIKIESFPFTKYGTIEGTVLHVSSDAVQDEQQGLIYPTRVIMAETTIYADGKDVPLTPGMSVTVEIKTGKRKLIDYILAPLKRYQDESMRER